MQTFSEPPHLRLATTADLPEIMRIYNESLSTETGRSASTPSAPMPTRAAVSSRQMPMAETAMARWLEQHAVLGRPLWVADDGRALAGWLSLLGFADRPNCGCAAEVAVYIGRARRGRGVGRALLEHALRQAPGGYIDRLLAFVWRDNAASLALFHAFGFEGWGTLPGVVWADGQGIDMLVLGRAIG